MESNSLINYRSTTAANRANCSIISAGHAQDFSKLWVPKTIARVWLLKWRTQARQLQQFHNSYISGFRASEFSNKVMPHGRDTWPSEIRWPLRALSILEQRSVSMTSTTL